MDRQHDVYLGLGSNLGDRKENITLALQKIGLLIGDVLQVSSWYETVPKGFLSENNFINAACHVRTVLNPLEVLEYIQVIERELGRTTKSVNKKYADRTIDIDILLYDDVIVEYPHLVVPHPHLHERLFVLDPLSEIASDIIHPLLKITVGELKQRIGES